MILKTITLLGFLLCCSLVYSFPQVTESDSLVASLKDSSATNDDQSKKDDVPVLPKIYEMRVDANVSNRFAKCQVTSKVRNLDKKSHEATFSVVIPEQAYISGFIMEIDGKQYEAYVQEKEQAKNTYNQAVQSGQAAAHVSVSARDSNRFTVSVNVEPQKKAVFYLKYEELLARANNQYELVINIHPGQPVKKLDVEVHIDESRPIKFVKAPPLRSGNEITKNDEKLNPNAVIKTINATSSVVIFSPDLEKQKEYATGLGTNAENGLAGQFVVQYDVEKAAPGGEVLVDGGHFVHFFSPDDLPALPKQVVFILDTSGSMDGIRITQLKEAMHSILPELKKEDIFSIIEFGSVVKVWNIEKSAVQYQSGIDEWAYEPEDPEAIFKNRTEQPIPPPYEATEENIKKAEGVVDKLNAFGGTDIQSALKTGLQIILKNKEDKVHQPLIVFLTDGEATVGEINNNKIITTITELNNGKTPIFSLSFGDGADRNFLQKLSLKNLGFNRHIYEAADASLQLQEFYKQISSPLLSNVSFKYVNNVTEVTKQYFPVLFSGSELIVSGQILGTTVATFTDDTALLSSHRDPTSTCRNLLNIRQDPDPGFAPSTVQGWGVHGPVELVPVLHQSVGSLERLWAYLTLQQYLKQRDAADNKTGPTQEALRIALKYSFVSDVTSLVVVKPNKTDAVDTEDGSSDKQYPIIASGVPLSAGGFAAPPSLSASGGYSNYFLQSAEDAQFDIVDRIAGGPLPIVPYPSTPVYATHLPTTRTTTTTPHTPICNTKPSKSLLEFLKDELPWLASVLNDDGILSLTKGKFKLGLNETISNNPDCPTSPSDQPGKCTLIFRCPEVYDKLTDLKVYEKYFCDLEGYAGVCCPK